MRESTLWLFDIIAAIILVITVLIHIFPFSTLISGIGIKEAVGINGIIERGKSLTYLVTYIIFLAAISYHPFYRLRLMLIEYFGGNSVREKIISIGCLIAAIILLVLGLYATIVLYLQ